jgi:hypothetical protein
MSFTNSDFGLLKWVHNTLQAMGFHSHLGLANPDGVRQIQMWRIDEVLEFIRILPLRHPEKRAKARLLLNPRKSWLELYAKWSTLLAEIKCDRADFVRLAAEELRTKHTFAAT